MEPSTPASTARPRRRRLDPRQVQLYLVMLVVSNVIGVLVGRWQMTPEPETVAMDPAVFNAATGYWITHYPIDGDTTTVLTADGAIVVTYDGGRWLEVARPER